MSISDKNLIPLVSFSVNTHDIDSITTMISNKANLTTYVLEISPKKISQNIRLWTVQGLALSYNNNNLVNRDRIVARINV